MQDQKGNGQSVSNRLNKTPAGQSQRDKGSASLSKGQFDSTDNDMPADDEENGDDQEDSVTDYEDIGTDHEDDNGENYHDDNKENSYGKDEDDYFSDESRLKRTTQSTSSEERKRKPQKSVQQSEQNDNTDEKNSHPKKNSMNQKTNFKTTPKQLWTAICVIMTELGYSDIRLLGGSVYDGDFMIYQAVTFKNIKSKEVFVNLTVNTKTEKAYYINVRFKDIVPTRFDDFLTFIRHIYEILDE